MLPAIAITRVVVQPVDDGTHGGWKPGAGSCGDVISASNDIHARYQIGQTTEILIVDELDITGRVRIEIQREMIMTRPVGVNIRDNPLDKARSLCWS